MINGPNRIDIELGGRLDSDAMKIALDELFEKSKEIENGRMLYRVNDFSLPTLGALAVEFSCLSKIIKLVGKFDQVAVLAEKE